MRESSNTSEENGELNVKVTEYVNGVNKVVKKGVEDYTTGASQALCRKSLPTLVVRSNLQQEQIS